ncbi:MAG: hypothetical protein JRH15_07035 [Deltaproteobacteria bacterium]|nr:hypothetical protein [Deltaproteobacteria bacterium]
MKIVSNPQSCLKGKRLGFSIALMMVLVFSLTPAMAEIKIDVGENPIELTGSIKQAISYSLEDEDVYDTQSGLQQATFQFILEADYRPTSDLRFFVSGMLDVDWAYELLSDDGEWNRKGFDNGRDELFVLDDQEDMLQEFHVTFTPGNWNIRLGKQIVSWGEMDGLRITDQINPLDSRRGFTDVQFESIILPIWLAKVEYFVPVESGWLYDLGLEFIFNPDVEFRGDEGLGVGNEVGGIWAPGADIDFGDGFIVHLGSNIENIHEPSGSDAQEWGFRLKANVKDSLITLLYFDGISNSPMPLADFDATIEGLFTDMDISPHDGLPTLHIVYNGTYHDQQYFGATFTRELTKLSLSALGGQTPVIRLEAAYFLDNIYSDFDEASLVETDEFFWGIAVDWKVNIPWINPKSGIYVTPQFFHRKILDYPARGLAWYPEEDNYTFDLYMETYYLRSRLTTWFYWAHDFTTEDEFFMAGVSYLYNDSWSFSVGWVGVETVKNSLKGTGYGLETFRHKDHVNFSITYQF